MRSSVRVLGVTVLISIVIAHAKAGETVKVTDAWARASAPGQTVAGVYLQIHSRTNAQLVGVRSVLTDLAELHFMSMKDGVMRMRRVDAIELPASKTVSLQPGGYHVMLFGLTAPLLAGEDFPIELVIEDDSGHRSGIAVRVDVRNLDGSRSEHHH